MEKKEIKPLDEAQIAAFLKAIQGHRFEYLYLVTLFTGMREGEVLGLQLDCVDLTKGRITINKQLQKVVGNKGANHLVSTKNGKGRTIAIAPFVISTLRQVRRQQLENRLRYGERYLHSNFVFTDELGTHLKPKSVYGAFLKK